MIKKVEFSNQYGTKLVGNLHLPENFDESKKYASIITVSPAGGVKEQTQGLYAEKMAENGFVALAYDASFRGESGGTPRYQEDPYHRVEDIRGAVDYLVSQAFIDEDKIGVIGICAGGAYAVNAAMTERRIKAVGSVVGVNGGRENREGGPEATIEALKQIADLRTAQARGEEPLITEWIPDEQKDSKDPDQYGGFAYYRTERGARENWDNKVMFSSLNTIFGYDAFYLADMLLTQPLQIIVGSVVGSFGSKKDGYDLYEKAASKKKDILELEGATHFDLYDNPKYVNQAVEKLVEFFGENL